MKRNLGALYVILAAVLWSLVGLFTKHIPWNGFIIGIVRGMIALVAMLIIVRKIPKKITKIKLITAFCYFAQGLLFVAANKYTSAANATVLQNTSPIYIMIFTAIIAKKLPKKRDVITCIVLLCGIVMSFAGSIGTGGMLGNVCALVSGVFYAGVYFSSRRPGADATESTILGNLFYWFLIPIVVTNTEVQASGLTDWMYALGLGITLALAWLCFSKGIKSVDSLHASFLAMLEPVLAPIWTLVFLQEKPGTWSIIGDVVVIATLLVYQFWNAKSLKEPCNEADC